jgi:pimeloyl-ACP methyl ester carboxylesterase
MEASGSETATDGPHSVESAARDILGLLSELKLFPKMLVGHSFGGKVVMSMVQQFGFAGRLPTPVDVWVLDTLPGYVAVTGPQRKDHPADLIQVLKTLPLPVKSRSSVVEWIQEQGFSEAIARWMTTNLKPSDRLPQHLVNKQLERGGTGISPCPTGASSEPEGVGENLMWSFDLGGISDMYRSYEECDLWDVVRQPPEGLTLHFVRAEHSSWRWAYDDQDLITRYGHAVHLLKNAGHWLHTDNPEGLFKIMKVSLGPSDEDRMDSALASQFTAR